MTYKELNNYKWLLKNIKSIELELKNLQVLSAAIINDMPGTKTPSNPTETFNIKKERLIEKLNYKRTIALNKQEEIDNFINNIEDDELETIFREYFVLGMLQKEIAEKHHMDRTTVYYKIKNYLKK